MMTYNAAAQIWLKINHINTTTTVEVLREFNTRESGCFLNRIGKVGIGYQYRITRVDVYPGLANGYHYPFFVLKVIQ